MIYSVPLGYQIRIEKQFQLLVLIKLHLYKVLAAYAMSVRIHYFKNMSYNLIFLAYVYIVLSWWTLFPFSGGVFRLFRLAATLHFKV